METSHNTTDSGNTRLQRPAEGRVLGGVATAIADHTGASVGLVRLGFLISALFGGFGIVLYAAAWALMPAQNEPQSSAERWLHNLTTPGKRLGAFLVGIAALIVLAGAAPATILAAATLLGAAALLANGKVTTTTSTPATVSAGPEEN